MIKIVKRKKNPYLAKYGYHVTSKQNLDFILKKGLIPRNLRNDIGQYYMFPSLDSISAYFFNLKRPIYFLDVPNTKKITSSMREHFIDSGYNYILKVNVEEYNQEPDYNMLIIDYNFKIFRYDRFSNCFNIDVQPDIAPFYLNLTSGKIDFNKIYLTVYKNNKNLSKSLKSILSRYDSDLDSRMYTIPFTEIKDNEELQEEFIFYTDTFAVNEKIPTSKIEDILLL